MVVVERHQQTLRKAATATILYFLPLHPRVAAVAELSMLALLLALAEPVALAAVAHRQILAAALGTRPAPPRHKAAMAVVGEQARHILPVEAVAARRL